MGGRPKQPPGAGDPPEPRSFCVSSAQAGGTLSALVRAQYVESLPWSRARELCARGKVRVNAVVETDAARRLCAGDQVEVAPAARRLHDQRLPDSAVLHCDRQVIVVDKPAGLLSVPYAEGDKDTLVDQVRAWLRRKEGQATELGVVQRLDKDTTGVIVFARTLAAKRHLQQLLRRHDIERRYRAIAHGVLSQARSVESLLLRDRGDGLRGSYGHFRRPRGPAPADAQRALTHVTPLRPLRDATLVECRLETGRQHQIRIHLSELGHPLVGESVYIRDYRGERVPAPRPMLHAAVLGFAHPAHGRPVRFERPPPEDFEALLAQLSRRS
jgi:23S rRNA pseudouridine1911/1915/1917 synthase